jgi:hypothetical protein
VYTVLQKKILKAQPQLPTLQTHTKETYEHLQKRPTKTYYTYKILTSATPAPDLAHAFGAVAIRPRVYQLRFFYPFCFTREAVFNLLLKFNFQGK